MTKEKMRKRAGTTTSANKAAQRRSAPSRRPRKRLRRYTLHYILLAVFLSAVVVVLSKTVFFKIEKIVVEGNEKYSDTEIIKTSTLKKEQNMFSLDISDISKKILEKYLYIEDVQIKRKLPHTISLNVEMVEPMGAILMSDGFTILTKQGRVVEVGVKNPPANVMVVRGLSDMDLKVGEVYDLEKTEEFIMLRYFVEALQQSKLDGIVYVNLSDIYNIKALYDDRILISFGTEDDLVYKMKKAQELVLCKEEYDDFEGVIDVSMSNEARVRRKDINAILTEDFGEKPKVEFETPPTIVYAESTIAESVSKSNSIESSNEILNKHLDQRKKELNPEVEEEENKEGTQKEQE